MKKYMILFSLITLFAPMPWGLALNHKTEECAGFWGGDEYGSFSLPEGWDVYYPEADNLVHTPIGSCTFYASHRYEAAESCCDKLPYSYVSGNIGEPNTSPLLVLLALLVGSVGLAILIIIAVIFVIAALIIAVIVLIVKKRRRTT
jgi:hypothetical protein